MPGLELHCNWTGLVQNVPQHLTQISNLSMDPLTVRHPKFPFSGMLLVRARKSPFLLISRMKTGNMLYYITLSFRLYFGSSANCFSTGTLEIKFTISFLVSFLLFLFGWIFILAKSTIFSCQYVYIFLCINL